MSSRTSPTVRRRRLAAELKRLRKESGKTREEVAEFVGCAPATVTKIENASNAAPPAYVALMLELYGVTGGKRDAWLTVARQARKRGWWQQYGGAIPSWFEVYLGLEEEASEIRSYHPEGIYGLLQTEDYMRAQILAESTVPPDEEIDRRIAIRKKRQERLRGNDAPQMWLVLGEAAIRRQVGGADAAHAQLHHLLDASRLNSVNLQVLPYTAGAHPGSHGPFIVLGFPEPADPEVVYVEYRMGSLYLESPSEVSTYTKIFDHLRARALGPDESRALITQVAKEMS
jgi:transcriptional regulator with XRE-family HTH domain